MRSRGKPYGAVILGTTIDQMTGRDRYPPFLGMESIGMPDRDKAKSTQEISDIGPEIKVLYTTGYARNAIVHHGLVDPGVNLLPKPCTISGAWPESAPSARIIGGAYGVKNCRDGGGAG